MKKISDIKVGYSCNNNCVHCVVTDHRDIIKRTQKTIDRTFDECKREIFVAKENGAEEIVLTGGEASIRDDFLDILTILHDKGLRVNLQTNGRVFHVYEFARKTAEFTNIYFSIALHGIMRNCMIKLLKGKGALGKQSKALKI